MGFKEMVEAANKNVFLNTDKFAELRTVKYNGEIYAGENGKGIPIILADVKQKDRRLIVLESGRRDNAEGLHMVTATLRCALSDLNGIQPEKGQRIKINHQEGGGGFFSDYLISTSSCDMGMLHLELEAIDE